MILVMYLTLADFQLGFGDFEVILVSQGTLGDSGGTPGSQEARPQKLVRGPLGDLLFGGPNQHFFHHDGVPEGIFVKKVAHCRCLGGCSYLKRVLERSKCEIIVNFAKRDPLKLEAVLHFHYFFTFS